MQRCDTPQIRDSHGDKRFYLQLTDDPWLIQRARVNAHRASEDVRVSEMFSLDYMGSSEFEWGQVPFALRNYNHSASCLVVIDGGTFPLKTERWVQQGKSSRRKDVRVSEDVEQPFFLLCRKGEEEKARELLAKIIAGSQRLKESTRLNFGWDPDSVNFWFDIENCFAFSTIPGTLERFIRACKISTDVIEASYKDSKDSKEKIFKLTYKVPA